MSRFLKAPYVLIMLSLLIISSPAAGMQGIEQNYDEITNDVADLRGLEILEPIDLTPLTREQLGAELEVDLADAYPAEERYADERELIAFGLMDPDIDLGQLIVALYSEQVAGYYDPETSEMVVVRDSTTGADFTSFEHITFAHEVVHALQDQHFDLDGGVLDREELSDDQSLAITALIEGDASFSELQYLLEHPALLDEFLEDIQSREFDSTTLDNAPALIRETLLFPYTEGSVFVEAIYEQGGWETVNSAFDNPPQSTEQILHPSKYLAGEAPVEVDVADFTSLLGDDWDVFDINTFGEFQIRIILQQSSMPNDQAVEAAAGWGGDTYVVAGTDAEDAIHWVSAWDSNEDALQFAKAFATYESDRWGVAPTYTGDSVMQFQADGVLTQIAIEGDTVTYIKAPDAATLELIANSESAQGPSPADAPTPAR